MHLEHDGRGQRAGRSECGMKEVNGEPVIDSEELALFLDLPTQAVEEWSAHNWDGQAVPIPGIWVARGRRAMRRLTRQLGYVPAMSEALEVLREQRLICAEGVHALDTPGGGIERRCARTAGERQKVREGFKDSRPRARGAGAGGEACPRGGVVADGGHALIAYPCWRAGGEKRRGEITLCRRASEPGWGRGMPPGRCVCLVGSVGRWSRCSRPPACPPAPSHPWLG